MKQVNRAKTVQTLRLAMTLAQELEIKLKKYEGFNDNDPSVMQVSATPQLHSTVMAMHSQQMLEENPNLNVNLPRPKCKANLTCYKCVRKNT